MEPPTDYDEWERQYEAELEMLREQEEEEQRSAKRVLFEPPAAARATPKSPPKRAKRESLREFDDDEDFLRDLESPSRNKSARPFSDVDEEALLQEDPTKRLCTTAACVLRLQPASDHVSVTGPDGTRVFLLKTLSTRNLRSSRREQKMAWRKLLAEPFEALLAAADRMRRREIALPQLGGERLQPASGPDHLPELPYLGETQLWVDEFAPRRYIDLLSDEDTNKRLLTWLKHWDPIVFNRPFTPHVSKDHNTTKRFEPSAKFSGDEKAKIVLLCGPPGCGKTTLAHVLARMCGYSTIEINASDDRSPALLVERVQNATQMQEIIARDRKPNCVILDEIDGATKAAVDAVVALVNGAGDGAESSKRRKSKGSLKRPIICICNDPYSKVLATLKKVAYVIEFKPISPEALTARLETICRKKSIKTDPHALNTLVTAADGDMRSCIGALQFSAAKTHSFTSIDVDSAAVSKKDKAADIRGGFMTVFRAIASRGAGSLKPRAASGAHTTVSTSLMQLTQRLGADESELLLQACFESYLTTKAARNDPLFRKVLEVCDSCEFYDAINEAIMADQQFALMPYLSVALHTFNVKFAGSEQPFFRWPRAQAEALAHTRRSEAVVRDCLINFSPLVQSFCNRVTFVTQMVFPLLHAVTPRFRPVVLAVLTPRERELVAGLVAVMAAYGVSVKQVCEDGRYDYHLEPSLGDLALFPLPPAPSAAAAASASVLADSLWAPVSVDATVASAAASLNYGFKQIIAQEVVRAALVKHGDDSELSPVTASAVSAAAAAAVVPATAGAREATSQAPEQEPMSEQAAFLAARIRAPPTKKIEPRKEPIVKDFFGRTVTPAATATRAAARPAPIFLFRFNEGCSNAVRRPMKFRELL